MGRLKRPQWLRIIGHRKEQIARGRHIGRLAILLGVFFTCVLFRAGNIESPYKTGARGSSRHLLATGNDSSEWSHTVEWEKCDFENANIPEGWVVSHTLCVLVIFVALAIICDDFFVPSLEAISEKLSLSEDVAGATFMAAGSSAPELFTSVAGVAVQTDVGVGTIVGSAVFNILIIIALTAALAGQVLLLDWRPLIRDSFFYAMSIVCFIIFSWDGRYEIYEAVILVLLYLLYILVMVLNEKLMDWMATWKCCCQTTVEPSEGKAESPDPPTEQTNVAGSNPTLNSSKPSTPRKVSLTGGHARRLSLISHRSGQDLGEKHIFHHHKRGSIAGALHPKKMSMVAPDLNAEDPKEESEPSVEAGEEEVEEDKVISCRCCGKCNCTIRSYPPQKEGNTCWEKFKYGLKWVIFVVSFPFVCLFSWTIPECSKEHNRKWFLVSFLMSVLWIAILSFAMVTLVGRTGCILGIDSYTMGLVVIAIGTSVPDALSSILVARDGYGDMAVSNAIGSNVFDINLGIGLPFVIRIVIDGGAPIHLLDAGDQAIFDAGGMTMVPHAKFGFFLLLILMLTLIVFSATRFRLTKIIGISFVIFYALFLVYAFVQEVVCKGYLC